MTRNAAKLLAVNPGCEVVEGNLDDPISLEKAMNGVDRVFLLTSKTQQDRNVIAAANKAGTGHVVKLSTQEAGWVPVEGHGHWHREREVLIQSSGLTWTFLRPCMFMNFALSWLASIQSEGVVRAGGGQGRLGPIAPNDVAMAAVAALTDGGHENKGYELTGPELLSFEEMSKTMGKAMGKEVRYIPISDPEQGTVFTNMGVSGYVVNRLVETFSLIRSGRFNSLTSDFEKLTGRSPQTFLDWACSAVSQTRTTNVAK